MKKLPVMLLSGFLGAGKTTLLSHLLKNNKDRKIALIVNDMASVNIDSELVYQTQAHEHLVEMSNGCICCSLREDLFIQIQEIASTNKFDYLIIESTGISEPLPVAQTFSFENENNISLSQIANLDALITVVDGSHFLEQFNHEGTLADIKMGTDENDHRSLAGLITEQIEYANILLLNKIDLLSEEQVAFIKNMLKQLNPNASIICSSFGNIDPELLFNTSLYNEDDFNSLDIWQTTLAHSDRSEADTYGINSFVYHQKVPFHNERFWNFIHTSWDGIVRVKGYFWLATRPEMCGFLSQAGKIREHDFYGIWWSALDPESWPEDEFFKEKMAQYAQEPNGDRRQEIVFIGIDIDEKDMREKLNQCLITTEELQNLHEINDPFPVWAQVEDETELEYEEEHGELA